MTNQIFIKPATKLAIAAIITTYSLTAYPQPTAFLPGKLAVLRIGDGLPDNGGTNKVSDWNFKQNADYIDEFDPNATGPSAPIYTMAFPTNGVNSIWNNGNAGSEACSMGRSADRSILTYSAYTGDILSIPGTPSSNPYHRIISVIDAFGNNSAAYVGDNWYGIATGKTNPRGVVSDGTNNFWGSGNNGGTLYYSPNANDGQPAEIQNFTPTRAVKIINNTVYTTITGKDSVNTYPCGIYDFVDFNNNPFPMPVGGVFAGFHLVVPAATKYTNISGFYMNDQGTIAYMADQVWGVQKYIKSGGTWQFACNFSVQGYEQSAATLGALVVTNDTKNSVGGAWDVVADFSGTNPVIYATTCDFAYYSGNFNSNRVVRIVDTNTTFSAVDITNLTVIAQAYGTNVGFRAIEFTPDLRPIISSVSDDQSVVVGTPVSFSVTASESGAAAIYSTISYQWIENGTTILTDQTNSTLTLDSLALTDSGSVYQCIVTNLFGSVTSTPPLNLTVTSSPQGPIISGAVQNLTNVIGDNVSITVKVTGTTPLSYQWYASGQPLSDANEFSGTTNKTLIISDAQIGVDDTNYYCVVTNIGGSASNLVASLKLVYTPPVFSSSPGSITVLSNTIASFSCSVFGFSPQFQWYTSNKVAIANANASTLQINPATTNQGYYVVVTNPGGAITSSVATVTVILPPLHSFVNYTNAGQLYIQNFDSLPVITNATVNTGNPVTFTQVGNLTVTYSVDDPFDFTYPILASGGVGGLGLTNTMKGWYGWGAVSSKLGAHQGDQSTGGIIDYGTLSTNVNLGGTNRALGVQSTSTTGSSAFGVKFINNTTNALSYITLKYIGELWRNQPNSNDIVFSYYIDTAGTNSVFSPTNGTATFVPSMNVSFNISAGGLLIVDGTQSSNQVCLAVTNLAIGNWPTNAALWLVWQQLNSQGSEQGEAIDNLSFSATNALSAPVVTPPTLGGVTYTASGVGAGLQFSFTNTPGASTQFTVWGTTNLSPPSWQNLGNPTENPPGQYQFTDPQATNKPQEFYKVTSPRFRE